MEFREQDKWLPIANVARIMKQALPENAKVSKEAKECMQECVSEFVSFITSEASEKCRAEKRKTVNGEDILFAMTSLGFENYAEVLKIYLAKYREHVLRADNTKSPSDKKLAGSSLSSMDGQSAVGNRTVVGQSASPDQTNIVVSDAAGISAPEPVVKLETEDQYSLGDDASRPQQPFSGSDDEEDQMAIDTSTNGIYEEYSDNFTNINNYAS